MSRIALTVALCWLLAACTASLISGGAGDNELRDGNGTDRLQ